MTAMLLLPPAASAGTATMQNADGSNAEFEYNDSMLRIGSGDADGYTVVRDGSIYVVSLNDGQPIVMDAGSMMKGFDVSAYAAPTDLTSEFLGLDDTGRSETVAGIKGRVYELRFKDGDGNEQSEEIVLSEDARALEFRDALFIMLEVASSLTGGDANEAGRSIQKRLSDMDAGVLRYGNDMRLTRIDGSAVDPARFELPAEPMSLEGLGGMLGAMGAQQTPADAASGGEDAGGGSLFSNMMNAIGGQADRQADRVGDTVEDEVNREADEQVDNAVGKALGKLFKR
jgi:hypothetical protein